MNKLTDWISQATPKELNILAKKAKTSVAYLGHISTGFRKAGVEIAANIERSTQEIANKKPPNSALPVILRGDLNETCRKCKYYKACNEDR